MTATFAEVTRAQVHDRLSTFVFVHSVTGPAVVELLLPYLENGDRALAVAYAWQAAAGIYASSGERLEHPVAGPPGDLPDPEDLRDRAAATQDEHAIKFTEACLRARPGAGAEVYLAAVDRALTLLR